MIIETLRFGEIEVDEDTVLTFPQGMWGFPDARRFALLPYATTALALPPAAAPLGLAHPVSWLQCLDDPTLAFLVINPFDFFPDYEVAISDEEQALLGLAGPEEVIVLALLTISRETGAVTANLAGPLVINARSRLGRQLVLDDPRYVTRHLVARLNASHLGREESR